MNIKFPAMIMISGCVLFTSALAFGNPSMLPNHPGYPMGDAKSPVTGLSVANDPGQAPPSKEESLSQAASFHDAQATNPSQEVRSNIVPPEQVQPKEIDAAGKSKE